MTTRAPAVVPGPTTSTVPWGRVGLVLGVIALAHLGLYLLLTASPRKEAAVLETRYGRAALVAATAPGDRPSDPSAFSRWLRDQDLWEARGVWSDRRHLAAVLGYALLASFLLQVGITGWLLARAPRRPVR